MKWYLAKIVFQIICGDGQHTPQFDEQLRLIQAGNEQAAFEKTTEIGLSEQQTFYNQKQQLVTWKFVNVCELYQLSLVDGAELYSRINEVDFAEEYIMATNKKAEGIRSVHSHKLLQLL